MSTLAVSARAVSALAVSALAAPSSSGAVTIVSSRLGRRIHSVGGTPSSSRSSTCRSASASDPPSVSSRAVGLALDCNVTERVDVAASSLSMCPSTRLRLAPAWRKVTSMCARSRARRAEARISIAESALRKWLATSAAPELAALFGGREDTTRCSCLRCASSEPLVRCCDCERKPQRGHKGECGAGVWLWKGSAACMPIRIGALCKYPQKHAAPCSGVLCASRRCSVHGPYTHGTASEACERQWAAMRSARGAA